MQAQAERDTSEGQSMERWKVTPPDTDPRPLVTALYPCSLKEFGKE